MTPAGKAKRKTPRKLDAEIRVIVDDVVEGQVSRLDASLLKLTEATNQLVVGVASEKQRVDYMEGTLKRLESDKDAELKALHERITATHGDLSSRQNDLSDRINSVQQELSREITASAEKQTTELKNHVDSAVVGLSKTLTDKIAKLETSDVDLASRITKLEMWRWILVGGGTVVGAIVVGILMKLVYAVLEPAIQALFK